MCVMQLSPFLNLPTICIMSEKGSKTVCSTKFTSDSMIKSGLQFSSMSIPALNLLVKKLNFFINLGSNLEQAFLKFSDCFNLQTLLGAQNTVDSSSIPIFSMRAWIVSVELRKMQMQLLCKLLMVCLNRSRVLLVHWISMFT